MIRWRHGSRGKRGGLRIVYLLIPDYRHIYLLDVYAKNEQADLSAEDLALLSQLADAYRDSLPHKLKGKDA